MNDTEREAIVGAMASLIRGQNSAELMLKESCGCTQMGCRHIGRVKEAIARTSGADYLLERVFGKEVTQTIMGEAAAKARDIESELASRIYAH